MRLIDFITANDKEKLIVTNSTSNVEKMIREINKKGTIISNVKVKSITQLVKEVVTNNLAKNGIFKSIDIIDSLAVQYLISTIVKKYSFIPEECLCDSLISEFVGLMNQIRAGKQKDEYINSNSGKIYEIKNVIKEYEEILATKEVDDYISLLNKAISYSECFNDEASVGLLVFEELTYLEKMFIDGYFNSVTHIDYRSVDGNVTFEFAKCYGKSNEVNRIIDEITSKKLPLSEVAIYYSNEMIEPALRGLLRSNGIDYRITSSYKASSDSLVQILKTIFNWAKNNYEYYLLEKLFLNSHFGVKSTNDDSVVIDNMYQRFVKGINSGIYWGIERYTNFSEEQLKNLDNDIKNLFESFNDLYVGFDKDSVKVSDLLEGTVNLVNEYYYDPDCRSLGKINSLIRSCKQFDITYSLDEALEYLINQLESLTISDEIAYNAVNCVKFTSNVEVLDRRYNYIIGLADKQFTVKTIESNILTDQEIGEVIDSNYGAVYFAKNNEIIHREIIDNTIATLSDGLISISYSNSDPQTDSELSPSSYFTKLSKLADEVKEYGSYPDIINSNIENKWVSEPLEIPDISTNHLTMSASRLNTLVTCPLEYYYSYIKKLDSIEYTKFDNSTWLAVNERGTIVHNTLENYMNTLFVGKKGPDKLDDKVLKASFEKAVNDMLAIKPCPNKKVFQAEKYEMLKGIEWYLYNFHYEMASKENNWQVYACELDMGKDPNCVITSPDKSLSLKITGIIDRVDFDGENYRIADYKSGKYKSKNDEVKKGHTYQHTLYVAGLKKMLKKNVTSFSYDFPFDEGHSKLVIDNVSDIDNLPIDVWEKIKKVYIDKDYSVDKCNNSYCKFRKVCKLLTQKGEEDE